MKPNQIHVIAKFTNISSDVRAAFKALAEEALLIAIDEPGVVQYEWFFDHGESECAVQETYRDSNALLEHISLAGEVFGRLVEVSGGVELELFGAPSAELAAAIAELPISVFATPFQRKRLAARATEMVVENECEASSTSIS